MCWLRVGTIPIGSLSRFFSLSYLQCSKERMYEQKEGEAGFPYSILNPHHDTLLRCLFFATTAWTLQEEKQFEAHCLFAMWEVLSFSGVTRSQWDNRHCIARAGRKGFGSSEHICCKRLGHNLWESAPKKATNLLIADNQGLSKRRAQEFFVLPVVSIAVWLHLTWVREFAAPLL